MHCHGTPFFALVFFVEPCLVSVDCASPWSSGYHALPHQPSGALQRYIGRHPEQLQTNNARSYDNKLHHGAQRAAVASPELLLLLLGTKFKGARWTRTLWPFMVNIQLSTFTTWTAQGAKTTRPLNRMRFMNAQDTARVASPYPCMASPARCNKQITLMLSLHPSDLLRLPCTQLSIEDFLLNAGNSNNENHRLLINPLSAEFGVRNDKQMKHLVDYVLPTFKLVGTWC